MTGPPVASARASSAGSDRSYGTNAAFGAAGAASSTTPAARTITGIGDSSSQPGMSSRTASGRLAHGWSSAQARYRAAASSQSPVKPPIATS